MNLDIILVRMKAVIECRNCQQIFSPIKGFLTDVQGFTLMSLAEHGPGLGEIVEIGSFMGRSTAWLAQGSLNARREKVTAIDTFKGSPEHQADQEHEEPVLLEEGTTFNAFERNLREAGLLGWVRPIIAPSAEAVQGWDKPIRLLFIDADHDYDAVKQDYELWSPFLVEGGVLVLHDVGTWPGVTKFYHELLAEEPCAYQEFLAIETMNVLLKNTPPSAPALAPGK